MNREYLIQLTQNLYRLTLLFPKKEPLRYKMREVADDILANLISINEDDEERSQCFFFTIVKKCNQNLAVLDGFFEVAKNQNWVALADLLRLQEEYNRIKTEIKKIRKQPLIEEKEVRSRQKLPTRSVGIPAETSPHLPPRAVSLSSANKRQQKILEFLKEKDWVQVWQAKQIFPGVSKRTLRRDFGFLLKQGKIERVGERNETFYRLKIGQK